MFTLNVGALVDARASQLVNKPASPEEREAAAARATLAGRLAATRLLRPNAANQIDTQDAARLMLILHVPNPNMRRDLYRSHIDVPTELDALYAQRPELAAWGSADDTRNMLEAEFWTSWADFVALRDWAVDIDNERVVIKRDYVALEPRQARVVPDTGDFVRFIIGLDRLLFVDHACIAPQASRPLVRRNALLLYVIACCLLRKNGRAVLDRPRFDWLGVRGRALVWRWLNDRHDRSLHLVRRDDADYLTRLLPVQASLDSLLRLVTIDLPTNYLVCPLPQCAPPAAPPRAEEDEETPEPPEVPARDDLDEGEVVEDEEAEAEGEGDAGPAPVARRIGAPVHRCAYHDHAIHRTDGLCAPACVAQRIGTRATHAHAAVAASAAVRRCAQPAARAQQVAGAIVLNALTEGRPRIRAELARAYRLPAAGTPATPYEWRDVTHALAHVGAEARLPDDVDAMAAACGWARAPPAERLARYVVAYGPTAHRDETWRARGWTMTPDVAARINAWCDRRPTVPLRTLQAIAYAVH